MKRLALAATLFLTACPSAGDSRPADDLEIGRADGFGIALTVGSGLAHVREMSEGEVTLWSQSPVLSIAVETDAGAHETWVLTVLNCMPDSRLTAAAASGSTVTITALPSPRATVCAWRVSLPTDDHVDLIVAPIDHDTVEPWRVVVMGDIQQGLPTVDEVFDAINRTPGARMIISTGDLVQDGAEHEYDLLSDQFETLDIPYYSTIGNHELFAPTDRWKERFGRFNVHFEFKGVSFTLVDSANASIAPEVYGWLDQWVTDARDLHLFGTHFPPLDPIGVRSGSFRSRKEAAKLLGRLADGGVDLTFYGHIHSYYGFRNAGIEAHISGGGGASFSEVWDGVGRHFLSVDLAPTMGTYDVRVIPVD